MSMRFRSTIEVPDEATYGAVMALQEHLNQHGRVSAVINGLGEDERYVEFDLVVESYATSLVAPQPWIVAAVSTTHSYCTVQEGISRYLKLADLWEDITAFPRVLGFKMGAPVAVEGLSTSCA